MPLSYATYTGNSGSPQSSFNIPYSYILKDHIKVYYGRDILANTQTALLVNGTDYNFTADNTIQLIGSTLNSGTTTGNPHNLGHGVVLTLERDTPDSSQIVEFADGSNLIGDNLNNANLQNLFVVQEQQDKNDLSAAKAISSENASNAATTNVATLTTSQFNKDGSVPMTGDINANSNKIKNLADPTNPQDGVTKAYLERTGSITSTQIADGTIVNADVNASAAIAQSKLDIANATQSAAGYQSAADKTKLDGIETGATADQTDAEIRSLVESASDSNVFTDQDHAKLNGIEAGATADQTNAEIRAAVEAASDSNVFTDNDHSKLNGIESGATADQTATEIKTLYESNSNTNPLTDAEKAVIDGVTANTSELNKLDGFTGTVADLNEVVTGKNVVEQITGNATDAQIPTAQAVNERVVELVTEVGGFHPIANETSFPTTNPDINDGAGTIVSLKALTNSFSTGSGVTTHTFTNGTGAGNNVIINGLPSNTTFQAGKGLLLETTTTLHTYTYHRLVLDESGVSNADALVSNFNERYYGPLSSNPGTRPSGANRLNGDLYFNNSDGKMKVYNGTHANGTWDDVAAPGNFFINTLSSSSGSGGGSATFNGTATRFTLSNPPNEAQQLLVSINGVIQKPNAGTSPSEGFAVDGSDIIFASAPLTGSSYFIVTIGSSVNIGTPSDNTVTSAKIVDGSIVNADISGSAAIASSKLAKPIDLLDNEYLRLGTGNDLELFHNGNHSFIQDVGTGNLYINSTNGNIHLRTSSNEQAVTCVQNAGVELYHNNAKKLQTTAAGIDVFGGSGFTNIWLYTVDGNKRGGIYADTSELVGIVDDQNHFLAFGLKNNHFTLKFDQSTKLQTTANGITVTGSVYATGSIDVQDNGSLLLGDADDLQIFHNGSGSFIDAYTTDLEIRNSGGELMAEFRLNNAVDLYHDGTKRLSTHSQGAIVNGHTLYIKGASGEDARLFFIANNSASYNDHYSLNVAATGAFAIQTEVNANQFENLLTAAQNGATELYYDNSKKFETTSAGIKVIQDVVMDVVGDTAIRWANSGTNKWSIFNNSSGNALTVFDNNGSGTAAKFLTNGAVELYHNNSKKLETTSTGVTVTGRVTCDDLSFIPSGTRMLFNQTNAPTGWTKDTSSTNRALRLVSGTVGTGGSNTFTGAFNSSKQTSGGDVLSHTLTTAQIPSHNHSIQIRLGLDDSNFSFNQGFSSDAPSSGGTFNSNNTGGGQGHDHGFTNPSFNLDVAYTDVIICQKD